MAKQKSNPPFRPQPIISGELKAKCDGKIFLPPSAGRHHDVAGMRVGRSKKCDATNWYEYGSEVAKRGQRINADTFVQQCEKSKADIKFGELDKGFKQGMGEYCDPKYSYIVGRRGDFLNLVFCDPPLHKPLAARHAAGVKEFCAKDNGYPFGASGKKYNEICPADLEKPFMVEYRRGRKNYLRMVVQQKKRSIDELDREVQDIDRRIRSKQMDLSRVDRNSIDVQRLATDPDDRQKRLRDIESERFEISNSVSGLTYQIETKRDAQRALRNEIEEAEKETVSLEN